VTSSWTFILQRSGNLYDFRRKNEYTFYDTKQLENLWSVKVTCC